MVLYNLGIRFLKKIHENISKFVIMETVNTVLYCGIPEFEFIIV